MGHDFVVETLTIELDDEVARRAKESALREHKSISEWIGERIKFDAGASLAEDATPMLRLLREGGVPRRPNIFVFP